MAKGPLLDSSLSIRLNDLDLVRATEQSALLVSLLMGRDFEDGGKTLEFIQDRGQWFRSNNIQDLSEMLLCGYLEQAYCRAAIAPGYRDIALPERDATGGLPANSLWSQGGEPDTLKLDMIVSPIDGLEDFRHGLPGSVCALAGGPEGSFLNPNGELFLVLALNRRLLEAEPGTFNLNDCIVQGPDDDSERKVQIANTIANILERLGGLSSWKDRLMQFTVGTMNSADEGVLRPLISRFCRMRVFTGSPVGAAVATFLPRCGIDAFTAIVNQNQAALIAVASLALGGHFFAMHVDEFKFKPPKKKGRKPPKPTLKTTLGNPTTTFLGTNKFVAKDTDVFLDLTGITDGLAVQGVRFLKYHKASTESLCLRSSTRTFRRINNQYDLKSKVFRLTGLGSTEDDFHCGYSTATQEVIRVINRQGARNRRKSKT